MYWTFPFSKGSPNQCMWQTDLNIHKLVEADGRILIGITTLGIMTLSRMTLNKATLSIWGLFATLSISSTHHNNTPYRVPLYWVSLFCVSLCWVPLLIFKGMQNSLTTEIIYNINKLCIGSMKKLHNFLDQK